MRNKHKLAAVKNRYTKLPNELLERSLGGNDIVVAVYLIYLPEDFDPSVRYLAGKLGCSANTIRKSLKNLETHGIIKKYSQGGFKKGNTTKYEFRPRNEWK